MSVLSLTDEDRTARHHLEVSRRTQGELKLVQHALRFDTGMLDTWAYRGGLDPAPSPEIGR